jgi:CheY-like chemotaxis protein/HPt (histidine-containing phosphotransfer) domain-containing protein
MNAIIGLTHLLRRGSKDARQIEQLSKIGDAAQHLLAVINDILDLSKIEAGKLVVDASDFEVERVVVAVCELVRERAEAKGLDLVVDPGREPPAVRGDRLRLQQILLDFLANAVKFTERGRVSLRATTVDDGGGRVFVRFSVSDTGIGIAPEHLGRLFEPFEQADASTTRRHGGTGLGLAISSRLAELMGGRIGVESEVGRGSTFWIEVPLERAAPSRRTSSKPAGARPSSAPGDLERALRRRGGRVLLVEDNPINQEVATELLRSVGLEVEVASDGRAAVELAAGRAYDVILMDLQMPGMDGLAATRLLRAMPEHARTPILAMTASAFDDDRAACLAVGMDDHVAKPVEPDALFRALLDWMPARAGDRARGDVDAPPPTPRGADEGAALEAVAGLDVRGGLDRCGGNFALYARLLRRWSTGDDAEDVRAALALGDRAAARLSAHTRKGVAATLGIARVAELAGDVERLLARPADPSGHAALDDAIDLLRAEESEIRARIVAALHTVDAAAGPTPPPTADVDPIDLGAARAHLAELAALLDADDVRAVKVFHEHEETIARAIGAKAAALGRQIAAFAFQEAAVTVREAMEGDSRA